MECNKKGQALVEFAIIIPILLLVVMGVVQIGLMLNTYITIENASREGARVGIMGSSDYEIKNAVIATSPSLNPAYLTITASPSDTIRKSGDTLTVKITYNYQITIPIVNKLFGNSIVLNGQTSMRVE